MSGTLKADVLLIERIRRGEESAWSDLIARFEGRLLAFAESRLGRRGAAEDVVQDTFIGFLNSLPNYDGRRSLESYLFAICAHKLTDHLRREGRRPSLPLSSTAHTSGGDWVLPGPDRRASSIARSGERKRYEETALADSLAQLVQSWKSRGDWVKLMCIELLFVRGWANKDVALELNISEQQVANFKFDFIARIRSLIRKQGVAQELFPELPS